jgi:hypothetical protein
VQAAKDLISAGASWITQVHGPEEARRIRKRSVLPKGKALNNRPAVAVIVLRAALGLSFGFALG